MKTNIIKSAACVFTLAMCLFSFSSASAQNLSFNNKGVEDLEPAQVVCTINESDNTLNPHMKHFFTYDNENRLIKKETFKWSTLSQAWECKYHQKYSYTADTYVIEYATWNENKKEYNDFSQKTVYSSDVNETTASIYTKKSSKKNWELISSMVTELPSEFSASKEELAKN